MTPVPPPRRVTIGLAELALAARLAGGVPLPVRVEPDAHGAGGARARLREQGLLDDDGALGAGPCAALHVLAGGPLAAVLDLSAVRRDGDVRLRSWFGVGPGLAAQLTLVGTLAVELAWFDPRLWVPQLTRAVRARPWLSAPAPLVLPDFVSLPSELLAGACRAGRERRDNLLAPLSVAHAGRIRLGDARGARAARPDEAVALLSTLGSSCRGRLRLLTTRRDRTDDRRVAAWLLLDDGWHELRPGRGATSVLRRRDARDLGLVTRPLVEEVA